MSRLITNSLPKKEHGYVVITYLFKHGGEASHIIAFDSDEECGRFDFDRWFLDRMMHEGGMFPLNGYERVSIDTIARIHCESFDKEDY
jgi:hypothetical protein